MCIYIYMYIYICIYRIIYMWMASEHIMARIIPGFLFSGFERPRFDKFGWIQAAVGFFKNGHGRQVWVWVKTLRINQVLFVWGVIPKYPQMMIIIDNPILGNATPKISLRVYESRVDILGTLIIRHTHFHDSPSLGLRPFRPAPQT